jgi:hypothetical protein
MPTGRAMLPTSYRFPFTAAKMGISMVSELGVRAIPITFLPKSLSSN